ncbi:hypothetical protein COCON_G00000240 [Conger conger]|uniref:SH3 domain-containing protein n=1 Tax=Conger conger TaxID=82655 RepID=A0A9Q1E0D5_CONCO|nr:hypothetical protein COCON_G00000240 [Conger conger]
MAARRSVRSLPSPAPQAKIRFRYRGEKGTLDRGEMVDILSKTGDKWLVKDSKGNQQLVPATYITELQPKVGPPSQTVLNNGALESPALLSPALLSRPRRSRSMRRGTTEIPSSTLPDPQYQNHTITSTQTNLQRTTPTCRASPRCELRSLLQSRRRALEEAVKLYRFYSSCQECESWMGDKESELQAFCPNAANVEVMQAKYESFLTQLASGRGQLDNISQLGAELVKRLSERPRSAAGQAGAAGRGRGGGASVTQTALQAEERELGGAQREIHALERKIEYLRSIAKMKQGRSPAEGGAIMEEVRGLEQLLERVRKGAEQRRTGLQEAQRRHHFLQETRDLLLWAESVRARLQGRSLLQTSRAEAQQTLRRLAQEWTELDKLWANQKRRLEEGLELQKFNREAERLEAALSGHEARTQTHPTWGIQQRVLSVQERARRLRESSQARRAQLLASKKYQEFHRDVEIVLWMEEKFKMAEDESYRDPTNILPKLKRHEAAEKEMLANHVRLDRLKELAEEMQREGHVQHRTVREESGRVLRMWAELQRKMAERGDKLRQAGQQEQLMELLQDAKVKMEAIQRLLRDAGKGQDLQSSRELLKEHQQLEQEARELAEKMNAIVTRAEHMATNHFDSQRILKDTEKYLQLFESLQRPLERRRALLEASVALFGFFHDVDLELSWISEHYPLASSTNSGQSLASALHLQQKHKELQAEVTAHRKHLQRVLEKGRIMGTPAQGQGDEVRQRSAHLTAEWEELEGRVRIGPPSSAGPSLVNRYPPTSTFNQSELWRPVHTMYFLFSCYHGCVIRPLCTQILLDGAELEARLSDLLPLAGSEDYGRNEPTTISFLKKQQVLEEQVEAVGVQVEQLGGSVEQAAGVWGRDEVDWPCSQINTQFSKLQHLTTLRWSNRCAGLLSGPPGRFEVFLRQLDVGGDRVQSCQELADALILHGHAQTRLVQEKMEQLRASWEELQDLAAGRQDRLQKAVKYHKFHRDLTEALALIQLQELLDAADSVLELCSPEQEAVLQDWQQRVVESWESLRSRVELRGDQLELTRRRYLFFNTVQEYSLWSAQTLSGIRVEESTRDLSTSSLQLAQHQQLQAEISAREETYQQALQLGQELLQEDPAARRWVQDRLAALEEEKTALYAHWKQKLEWLQVTHLEQVFYRDANHLDKITNSQEILLRGGDLGTSVDETDLLIKRHEAFEKLVNSQEDKVGSLQEQVERLGEQGLSKGRMGQVQGKLRLLLERRNCVKQLTAKRRDELTTSRLLCVFNRNATEAEEWISDRMQKLQEDCKRDLSDLQTKLKLLQKHQVFEAEILAHHEIISAVQQGGAELVSLRHARGQEVRRGASALTERWEALKRAVASRGRLLEDNRDFLEFLQRVEQVEAWIRQKEVMVNVGDMGEDYEHGLQLLRKLNEFRATGSGEVTVDDAHIKAINNMAARLERQNREEVTTVKQRRLQLNERYLLLCLRMLLMRGLDYGQDLEAVENLIRRHEETEREVRVIQERSKTLEKEARAQGRSQSEMTQMLSKKQQEVKTALVVLEKEVNLRKEKLQDALQLQRLRQTSAPCWTGCYSTALRWSGSACPRARAEIEARGERFDSLRSFGRSLMKAGHSAAPEVQKALTHLDTARTSLDQIWQDRKLSLEQALELQVFLGSVEQCERWLSSQEAFLSDEDLGGSLGEVEVLQRKQVLFEQTLEAQMEQVGGVERFAQQLVQKRHYDSDTIQSKSTAVLLRKKKLLQRSEARRRELEDSLQLHTFLGRSHEPLQVCSWLGERNTVALDESWRDPTNLQAKLLKHQSLEAQILANHNRVETLTKEAEAMLSVGHFAAERIRARQEELQLSWDQLLNNCREKKSRLQQAYQALQFQRSLEDMEEWLVSVETGLGSEDCGADLPSVGRRLKELQEVEEQVEAHLERIQGLVDSAQDFRSQEHFLAQEIQCRVGETVHRYNSLAEPLQDRREALESWQLLFQFYRDLEDELLWVRDKLPAALSKDWGSSLYNTQALVKKHQALVEEMGSRIPLVQAVQETGQSLVRGNHFDSREIGEQLGELRRLVDSLRTEAESRGRLLQEALQIQTFLAEVSELDLWVEERRPVLDSVDFGKSEEATQALLRKLDTVDLDLESHRPRVESLQERGTQLERVGHPNSVLVRDALDVAVDQYHALLQLSEDRRASLEDRFQLYVFEREARELQTWISARRTLAESQEYGQDLEDVEVLQKKFEDFRLELQGLGQGKVSTVLQLAQEVRSSESQRREAELHRLWEDLQQAVERRAFTAE